MPSAQNLSSGLLDSHSGRPVSCNLYLEQVSLHDSLGLLFVTWEAQRILCLHWGMQRARTTATPCAWELMAERLLQMGRQLYSAGLGASGSLVVGEVCRYVCLPGLVAGPHTSERRCWLAPQIWRCWFLSLLKPVSEHLLRKSLTPEMQARSVSQPANPSMFLWLFNVYNQCSL